jgi:hypothetical protein
LLIGIAQVVIGDHAGWTKGHVEYKYRRVQINNIKVDGILEFLLQKIDKGWRPTDGMHAIPAWASQVGMRKTVNLCLLSAY